MTHLNRRVLLGAGVVAAALPLLPRATAAQALPPAAQGAGWYGFRVGEFRCAVISDGGGATDFKVADNFAYDADPAEVVRLVEGHFADPERANLAFNALYVDTGRNKVLIDTGCSDKAGPANGKLPAGLRTAGIDPASIDTVVISHAHFDHLSGVLDPVGKPVFAKARYVISEPEHAFWTGDAAMPRSPLPAEMLRQFAEGARAQLATIRPETELVATGREVVPGITAVFTPGHTPGHQSFVISSGGESLFVTVDIAHNVTTAMARPEWKVAFDADPDLAAETRRRTLDRLAADRVATLFYHFPFPGLGHVARHDGAYAFEPIVWSWDPQTNIG